MKKNLIKVISVLLLFSSCTFTVAERVIQHEAFSASDVKNIKVEASSGDVKILAGTSSSVIVETYSNKSRVADVEMDLAGGTLSIDATVWEMTKYPPNVRIFVPKGFSFEDLSIKISSGGVEVKNLSLEKVNLVASSGNINIDEMNCSNLIITTSSGSVNLDEINSNNDVSITTSSGSVNLDEISCKQFKTIVTSGSVDADDISCDVFDVESTSGKIICEKLVCQKFSVKANSGKVDIGLKEMVTENSSIKTTSGAIVLNLPKQNSGYKAIVDVNSGKFTDEFTGMSAVNSNNATSVYKSGDVKITLNAKSGSIKIKKADR